MHRALLLSLLLVPLACAHICILQPRQRGPLNVSDPGDDSCFRRTPYCGGIAPGAVTATYRAGDEIEIVFQQNLNHWSQDQPGYFDVAISYDALTTANATFKPLGEPIPDFPAMDMVTQTNFSLWVKLPTKECSVRASESV